MSRPKVITLAPVALDRNGLAASETLASTGLAFTLDGTLTNSAFDVAGLVASVTPSAETVLTLKTTAKKLVVDSAPVRISVQGGSDESGKTFLVIGRNSTGDLIVETITGPNADTVFGTTDFYQIVSVTASAAMTGAIQVGINGAYRPSGEVAQHITIFSAGNDVARTFTVTGTDRYDAVLTEDITGVSGSTALGVKNFKTVTSVVCDGATAGAAEVGIDGLAETQWFILNYRGHSFNVGLGVEIVSGTLTVAVQHTFDADIFLNGDDRGAVVQENELIRHTHELLTALTSSADGNYTNPPIAIRLAATAFTSGSAKLRVVQAG